MTLNYPILNTLIGELSIELDAAERSADAMRAALDWATADKTKLTIDLAAAVAEIQRLTALIPVPPGPTVGTLLGSSLPGGAAEFDALAKRVGGIAVHRVYRPANGATTLASLPGSTDAANGRVTVLSAHGDAGFDVDNASAVSGGPAATLLTGLLSSMPDRAGQKFIWQHEPEGDGAVAGYVASQIATRKLVDKANTGRKYPILFGGCLMAQTANIGTAGTKPADYYPGAGVWDFLAWDGYSKKPTRTAAQIFDACLAFNKSVGLPFAIAEFGAYADPTRAAFIRDVFAYAKAAKALFACYWNASDAAGNDFRLTPTEEPLLGLHGA